MTVDKCEDCLGRTPYASLIATITTCLGVGLFCGSGYRALDLTVNGIFNRLFNVTIPWLQNVQVIFLIFGISMGIYTVILLTFGFLSTGLTRENLFANFKSAIGGRVFAGLLMVFTYVLNMAWLGITFLCAMPIIIYVMVKSICQQEIVQRDFWFLDNYCLNLTRFGIYQNSSGTLVEGLCDEIDLSQFCEYVYDAGPMYCFAYIGSFLIVLGLTVYLVSLSSNYQRIKSSRTLKEYRSYIDLADPSRSERSLRD